MQITKTHKDTSSYLPLEEVKIKTQTTAARQVVVSDSLGRVYVQQTLRPRKTTVFQVRGEAGKQRITILGAGGKVLEEAWIRLKPHTEMRANNGPYAAMFAALERMIKNTASWRAIVINGRPYRILIGWSRDHVYTLKAAKYFIDDVKSGVDYFLERQLPNGMFWDCLYSNPEAPAPTWFADALGEGWFTYDEGKKFNIRRVPVLADTEYVFIEGVWHGWKASADDAWMAAQLPRLEKALTYMTTDPLRWSPEHGLMRRSFTIDEWDFANQHYCAGDHRCIYPQDPRFLFHGNQSGLYSAYWRMAEMYEHLGKNTRAAALRKTGEALRQRANDKLFFGTQYGHMIPETLPEQDVYALVGDERERMSLSTGYTINRKLPTHEMAVKILQEYQRRAHAKRSESFAEWWSVDPMYTPAQWPGQTSGTAGCPVGEYMNGGVTPLVAGELAKAAFDHGMETYGIDILERLWKLAQRDGGWLHQVYKRLPEKVELPPTKFQLVDLRSLANRGLQNGTHQGVEAWMSEGDNDMRNLPTGTRKFGVIEFDVIKPDRNDGRAILRLDSNGINAPAQVTIPIPQLRGQSIYFLHCTGKSTRAAAVATYTLVYEDQSSAQVLIRPGKEIGHWWGSTEKAIDQNSTRRAWWGANPKWKNVGIYMFGLNNPHPEKAISAIRIDMFPDTGGSLMLAAISLSDHKVAYEVDIRSYGLPDCWAQGAPYYALAEGLAGIEDTGAGFSRALVAPRWAGSQADDTTVTLHYPGSDGYCSYHYKLDRHKQTILLDLTGSFHQAHIHCLLPQNATARRVRVAGQAVSFKNNLIEKSHYVDFDLTGVPQGVVKIEYVADSGKKIGS